MIEQAQLGTVTAYITNDPVTGQPLMLQTSTGTVSLYVYSGNNGSPVGLITDAGIQSYSYEFDPYGTPVLSAGGTGNGISQNPFLFQGGIQDRATGWVKFGARWYNPTTGRWTQQDTLDNPLDPNNANRYAYAGNDPVNNIDPTGRVLGLGCVGGIAVGSAIAVAGIVEIAADTFGSIAALAPTAGASAIAGAAVATAISAQIVFGITVAGKSSEEC